MNETLPIVVLIALSIADAFPGCGHPPHPPPPQARETQDDVVPSATVATQSDAMSPIASAAPSATPSAMASAQIAGGCPPKLDDLVGKTVTLRGEQIRSKQPTVCGADVEGFDSNGGKQVQVTGVIRRYEIKPRAKGEPIVASRGPGVYYSIVDPTTGRLAVTVLVTPQ
jgi:hypothetical protein